MQTNRCGVQAVRRLRRRSARPARAAPNRPSEAGSGTAVTEEIWKNPAPPPGDDGTIRIVEIVGLDRQACGGTHLPSTGRARALRILKIDNKGRHNRRVRIGLDR